ncbi:hypothetical protein, partial [Escherichia coli]|uniref:hypothetical protein n=2 Tax=Bacteria TaxID=2 RepID=UPI003C6BF5E7
PDTIPHRITGRENLLAALREQIPYFRQLGLSNLHLIPLYESPAGTAWVNYVRGHDDIGWAFSEDDAATCSPWRGGSSAGPGA